MTDKTLLYFNISGFQKALIEWYRANKRDLPWHADRDPYKIWVSEIMLQQTQVDTVIPYFQRFMSKYPTVQDLAEADQQDVLKTWEGLGYYSRARHLQNAVRDIVTNYNGRVPDDPKELGSLQGIGPYTKGAILSIAFHQPIPAVDGNVMRVLARILNLDDNIAKSGTKKKMEQYVEPLISHEDPSSFNQGMMELGALVCTPKEPLCMFCPVQEYCRSFHAGTQHELPVKSKQKSKKTIPYVVLLIQNGNGEYVIEKRPDHGLLANMWQFPMVPMNDVGYDHIEQWFRMEYGMDLTLHRKKGAQSHVFSHRIWQMEAYTASTGDLQTADKRIQFISHQALSDYPIPVPHQKMMAYMD
ncbi:A/G-specific adenine glycosylase [Lentibacillus halophilus]|uniref:Adenine DNA glycosylase n=1 Tax=Lentibacillus halophilus TaxID=295065 RepID=A0ABP3J3Z4_9BACI